MDRDKQSLGDRTRGETGTAVVAACTDTRVTRCEVRVLEPPGRTGTVWIEPGTGLEVGSTVDLLVMPGGRVEAYTWADGAWTCGLLARGVLVAGAGARRLRRGPEDPERKCMSRAGRGARHGARSEVPAKGVHAAGTDVELVGPQVVVGQDGGEAGGVQDL